MVKNACKSSISLLKRVGKQNLQYYGKWNCNTMEKCFATFMKKYLQKTPKYIKSINQDSFYNCVNLKEIYILSMTALSIEGESLNITKDAVIFIQKGATGYDV
ncbi:MAG: hypothetical protein P9M03_07605, partial [Candidatus Theseobacter exili]|nr:hypothetical protein [Candidatus Theseobacter exili]